MKSSIEFRSDKTAIWTITNAAKMGLVVAVGLSAPGCAVTQAKKPAIITASVPSDSPPASPVTPLPPSVSATNEPFTDGTKVQSAAIRLSVEDYARANRSGLKTGGRSTGGGCSSGSCNGCGG